MHGCVTLCLPCLCLMQEIDLPSFDRVVFENGGSVNEVRRDSACVSVVSD
jgi:hypothetical protein